MKNFLKLAAGIDVVPLLLAVQRQPELWNQYTVRTHHPESAHHRGVDDLILRYNKFERSKDEDFVDKVCSRIEVENYPAWVLFPQARQIALGVMLRTEGLHLGRVFLARLNPGGVVPPHSDRIAPAEEAFPDRIPPAVYYDRYHVVVSSSPGVEFNCGGEQAEMQPGELWWFNNQLEHEVKNNSPNERIHMVLDIHHGNDVYAPEKAG